MSIRNGKENGKRNTPPFTPVLQFDLERKPQLELNDSAGKTTWRAPERKGIAEVIVAAEVGDGCKIQGVERIVKVCSESQIGVLTQHRQRGKAELFTEAEVHLFEVGTRKRVAADRRPTARKRRGKTVVCPGTAVG
jgi:hypothetical protein